MKTALIYDAPSVFKLLNGIVCVYKSAGESFNQVRHSLLHKLSQGTRFLPENIKFHTLYINSIFYFRVVSVGM